jgi:adenylate cyclase
VALEEASTAASRAIELDDRDAFSHAVLSRVHSARGEFDIAIEQGQTAVALNPNEATAHYYLAWAMQFSGRPGDALSSIETALRLNPRGPDTFGAMTVGTTALIALNRFEDAVDWAKRSLRLPRGKRNFWNYASLLSALGHLDRLDEALDGLLRLRPDFSPDLIGRMLVWSDDAGLAHYFDGLRKAGLEV